MPLVPAPDMLAAARADGYALGYFESWDSYSLEAVLAAAEAENAPVIVGFGATMLADEWLDAGGIEFLGASGRALLEGCRIPASFLLNETHTLEQAVRGVAAGFNFVMIDSHRWPVPEARDAVAKLVAAAHPVGVAVEAEFGSLPDYHDGAVDDSHAYMTDPGAAAEFVAATGRGLPRGRRRQRAPADGLRVGDRPRAAAGHPGHRRSTAGHPRRDRVPACLGRRGDQPRRGEVQRRHAAEARFPGRGPRSDAFMVRQ